MGVLTLLNSSSFTLQAITFASLPLLPRGRIAPVSPPRLVHGLQASLFLITLSHQELFCEFLYWAFNNQG